MTRAKYDFTVDAKTMVVEIIDRDGLRSVTSDDAADTQKKEKMGIIGSLFWRASSEPGLAQSRRLTRLLVFCYEGFDGGTPIPARRRFRPPLASLWHHKRNRSGCHEISRHAKCLGLRVG